uniref:BZIP domain-containing protein n=1 Tax=Globisporangium ultimum (strain ATCC 200006 / CBS 805.95 / DAOM BR144) TaxID=431595 RepID=K3WP60_GLOUD
MNADMVTPLLQDWDDEDREMMQFLLLGGSPSGVDYAGDVVPSLPEQQPPQNPKHSKAKLSAMERREKHREVVRRSYHRNKAVLMDLRDTVKKLEEQMKALAVEKRMKGDADGAQQEMPRGDRSITTVATGKEGNQQLEELQRECDALKAQSQALESESTQLRETLKTHQQFIDAVYMASDDTSEEDESGDSDDCFSVDRTKLSSPWSEPTFPETSDEDFSPDKRKKTKFYSSPRPAHAVDVLPRARLSTELWRDIGFKHLSLSTARMLVNEAYQGILNFSLSGQAMSTGARVMGWEDKRLMDGSTIKFSLRKKFMGQKANELMTKTWMCLSDPDCADEKFRGLLTLRILQHVNDDTIIALRDTVSPDNSTVFRCVYLLFRVRTRAGFIICSRSINHACVGAGDQVTHTKDGKVIHWVNLFGWFVFDQLGYADHSSSVFHETGAQLEYGGSMNYGDASHLPALAMDTLSIVSRWESFMIPPVFVLPPSF